MRRTRVKFCGFTNRADLDLAVGLGVDAIGLIAVPGSKRQIDLQTAIELRAAVPAFVSTVLLLLEPAAATVRQWIDALQPDLLQFHGRESAEFCDQFRWPYLKALSGASGELLLSSAAQFPKARGILLDAHEPGARGGTGESFDWDAIPLVLRSQCILSGGLRPDNVGAALARIAPFAVDVASGIESAPGRKCPQRMYDFLAAVRAQDEQIRKYRE